MGGGGGVDRGRGGWRGGRTHKEVGGSGRDEGEAQGGVGKGRLKGGEEGLFGKR